jgi:zinc transporter ZupT
LSNQRPLTLIEKIVLRVLLALGILLIFDGLLAALINNGSTNLTLLGVLITVLGTAMTIVGYRMAQGRIRLQRSKETKQNPSS